MNKNKPTAAMRTAAKKGLEQFTAGEFPVTPMAQEVGKKIASGQELSDDHVTHMAHFHSGHDTCPGDCEDLLWGGPAGEVWAKGKIIQAMNTGFAEENIDFKKIINDDNVDLSLEVFSNISLDEPIELGEDNKGYIWAPILRSGMLATRPGPNGEKLDEPLVFIPGHSENQRKEIGLQDVFDAFKDKAVEYVTLPTTHENNLLDNTGFVRDLKIVDSKKFPGEKVILAAHDFTEPDIKGKVERGTIPSRSSGLLYNYKNTTTGKVYPIALDHTALTHKPWMGGMAAYGSLEHDDLSDRTIVPVMLSEKPLSAQIPPDEITKPTKLAQEITKSPQSSEQEEIKSEFLADIQWGESPSYRDIEKQIDKLLQSYGSDYDSFPQYFVIDCTDGKALIKVNYGIGTDNDAWVAPFTVSDKGTVELSPFSDWTDVTKKWVSDDIDPKQDKEQLDKLKMGLSEQESIELGVLSSKARKDLPKSDFVYPSEEKYPIHDIAHGRNALARVSQNGSPEEQSKVRAAVYKRYPELKSNNSTKMSSDPLKEASLRRLGTSVISNQPPGGQMTLLVMSEEQMGLLGLSDEAKEFQRKQNEQIEKMNVQLAQAQKSDRESKVASKIAEYKNEGFDAFPGLLKEVESTMMSDDGDIAIKLQLSENGHEVAVPETATQLAERFMKSLPRKDGKVDLGEQANRLESPDLSRPLDKPEDPNAPKTPKDADELLAEWGAANPALAKDPEFLALSENGKGK